ncbi:MAG: hypothetical protein V1835_06060 [Candidatus Micrarchaeota archaeon]
MGIGRKTRMAAMGLVALAVAVMATTYYGYLVAGYSFVLNPNNALDDDYDYATLQYATNITCPLGNFYKSPSYPNYFCVHNGTSLEVGGWEVIRFSNYTGYNITNVKVKASDLNIGCTSCASAISVRVFRAGTTYDSGTQWTYVGQCNFADNANQSTCTLYQNASGVGHILIGRWNGGNFRPDPAVHVVSIGN